MMILTFDEMMKGKDDEVVEWKESMACSSPQIIDAHHHHNCC